MAKFCGNCGAALDDKDQCPNCNAKADNEDFDKENSLPKSKKGKKGCFKRAVYF